MEERRAGERNKGRGVKEVSVLRSLKAEYLQLARMQQFGGVHVDSTLVDGVYIPRTGRTELNRWIERLAGR